MVTIEYFPNIVDGCEEGTQGARTMKVVVVAEGKLVTMIEKKNHLMAFQSVNL
jgi:hypothetical protein